MTAGGRRQESTRRALLAFAPVLLVLILGAAAFDSVRRAQEIRAAVTHSRELVDRAQATLLSLQDAETGQRGFLLTGEPRYLAPYERALVALRADTTSLRRLIGDSPAQQARLDSLEATVRAKLQELAATIALRRERGPGAAAAMVRSDEGIRLMDAIRTQLGAIVASERAVLTQRQVKEAEWGRAVTFILVVGTIAAALLTFFLNRVLVRSAAAEARLARELEGVNTRLVEQTRVAQRAQLAAEQANRAKSDFLASMSHELRTPLNAIAGHAQLIELGIHGPVTDAQREALARIQHGGQHVLMLVNDVLNFAKLEAGRIEFDVADVPLAPCVADVLPMIEPQLAAGGLQAEVEVPPGLKVRADQERVGQIILNLLSNAVKFTDRGGTIRVDAPTRPGAPPGMIFLRVSDTGIGIPREKQEIMFEPFVQVHRDRKLAVGGTGLGLAISRDLARRMGGDLRVRSTEGKGSAFTLTLPAPPATEESHADRT